MKKWQCTVCGYIHKGDEPPDKCPVCGADKSLFTLIEEEPAEAKPAASVQSAQPVPAGVTQWRCTVCGYIHKGDKPPEQCPVCGADKSKFVPVVEEPAKDESGETIEEDYKEAIAKSSDSRTESGKAHPKANEPPYQELMQLLTKLHGHPIAVHIPNGLLPVSVLFTFIAVIFGSQTFAIAARYNIGFVALAMPIVIATGYIDWLNRYKRAMTKVFKIKIACAAVVTLLSIILALWWIIDPEIYNRGIGQNGFFLLLNLINLATAVVAGWFGGKLVFKN